MSDGRRGGRWAEGDYLPLAGDAALTGRRYALPRDITCGVVVLVVFE